MAIPDDLFDKAVAYLQLHHSKLPGREQTYLVLPNDDFRIGRQTIKNLWSINEPTVSTHHLHFRCVVYEDDSEHKISPMVYVRVLSTNPVQLTRAGMTGGRNDIHSVSKRDPDVLLGHGDALQITPDISVVFTALEDSEAESNAVDYVRANELRHFEDQFDVTDRRLGVGGNASVFVAVKQRTKRQVACKVVPQPFIDTAELDRINHDPYMTKQQRDMELRNIEQRLVKKREDLTREYTILRDLSHPNVITLEKVICATYNIYIFQELITGGDLLSYMEQKGPLGEAQAAVIIRQVLKAVEYLHERGVVHRDIKPENILMTCWRDGARIVLTDFGQARTTGDARAATNTSKVFRMQSLVGTHGYTAPEVFKQVRHDLQEEGYSKAIDIWSIGCITATLLTNEIIFPNQKQEFEAMKYADHASQVDFSAFDLSVMDHGGSWASVGRKAKSFVRGCVVLDESKRLTVKQALLHPWFTNKYYAADIEAAYGRAIEDWTPRKKGEDLIEFIDTKDAVSATARPDHAKRLAEEVTSRHFDFDTLPPPPPTSLFFGGRKPDMSKPTAAPMLPVAGHVEQETIEVPASPPAFTQYRSLLPTPANAHGHGHALWTMGQLSIEHFAPPWSQYSLAQPPPGRQFAYNDSLTQSQPTLDDLPSPAKRVCR
ncbi:hypothetical protein LTR37_008172 [Vermiconidia calcicola]|uniref:Uncharacterized protein n=1 Tax=Vermiconidia calcicola TaxID=1690605 RepID=A0ACC3NC05_9PEZI|nr:hypothetical protein LTR37_008172 [Vermiconidia calcicola]